MLREITIQKRLMLAFLLIIALLLGVGAVSLSSMKTIRDNAYEVEHEILPDIIMLREVNLNLMQLRIFTLRLLLDKNETSRQKHASQIQDVKKIVEKYSADYQLTITNEKERQLYNDFASSKEKYYLAQQKIVELVLEDKAAEAENLLPDINALTDTMTKNLAAIEHFDEVVAKEVLEASISMYNSTFWFVISIIAIAATLALAIAKMLASSINKPLQDALRTAETVASGDLTQNTLIRGDDELTRLAKALQTMQANLREAIVQIGNSSSQLASAAEELNVVR